MRGIWVHWDLTQIFQLKRFSDKNRPILLRVAAQRYAKFLRNRFISLSAGSSRDGQWRNLVERTIKRKERRLAKNPHYILRETDQLLNSIRARSREQEYIVGVFDNTPHIKVEPNDPDITILELVKIHQGIGKRSPHIPIRPIVVLPNGRVQRQMVNDVRKEYDKIIRKNRRKGK